VGVAAGVLTRIPGNCRHQVGAAIASPDGGLLARDLFHGSASQRGKRLDPARDSDNPIDFIWQGILGGLTRIIRNHPKDRFGTRVPLSGNFDDPSPDVMTTIVNVFRNAFIKAFEGKLENENIELPKVDKEKH